MSQLTGSQFKQVQSALLSGYDPESLAMMVRVELDQNLAAIAGRSNLAATVFDLITWAERTGMTGKLIEGACRYNPGNPDLQALAAAAKGWGLTDASSSPPPATPESPPPVAAPGDGHADDGYAYDVFISYSSKDADWVRNTLLPRLEQAGLCVCIDYRDFEIGVASIVNMERASERSRRTLLVLTPDWVASEWTGFEALLVQTSDPIGLRRRTIPLLRKPCELPSRIAVLTYVDLTRPDDAQWERLIRGLRPS